MAAHRHPHLAVLSIFLFAGTRSRFTCRALLSQSHPLLVRTSSALPSSTASGPLSIRINKSALGFSSSAGDTNNMKKRVLIPISDGSEEIETTCIQDTLVRFGAEVVIASCKPHGDLTCTMSRGIKILADTTIDEAVRSNEEWDLVALPGGMPGAEHLRDCKPLIDLLKQRHLDKKMYAAICASPAVVLASHGLLPKAGATCYPLDTFRAVLTQPSDEQVVVQENVVTSQGPGTSLLFSLALGERLYGKEKADAVAKGMLVNRM